MNYFVYILYSNNYNRFYTGMTNNIERRLKEHNMGMVKSTKGYIPWVVVYSEIFKNRTEARAREKYLKAGSGREFIKKYIPR